MYYQNTSIEYIQSRSNQIVIQFSKLADKKYRYEQDLFLCEGDKLVEEALKFAKIDTIFISESIYNKKDAKRISLYESAINSGAKPYILSDSAFEKISSENAPQGIIGAVKLSSLSSFSVEDISSEDKVIFLDSIRDPGNIGTILRSAVAFGFNKIILHDSCEITNPKVVRAAMGAIFKIASTNVDDMIFTISLLKNKGRKVIASALSNDSKELNNNIASSDIVVIGNEGHGLSQDTINACSMTLKIPMMNNTESLNASIAASIIMWEQSKK